MNSTLILPTEECVDADTVKRALLNYEKVYLKHPDDRDFVPGNDVAMLAVNGPGMSMGNSGLAKPLGKEKYHDMKFDKLVRDFAPAIVEGSLVIMEKPAGLYHNALAFGYEIDNFHKAVYWNYRNMLADAKFIKAASKGIDRNWLGVNNNFDDLAPVGVDDGLRHSEERLNDKLSFLGEASSEEERLILTRMVHARIASISRNLMLCDNMSLVPFTNNIGYSQVINQMQYNYSYILNEVNDGSMELSKLDLLGKVEKVMFSDFMDVSKISNLSIKQVLKLRTKMWGQYEKNKNKLEEYLFNIALETQEVLEFQKKIKGEFESFLKENRDFIHERKNLGIKLACNIGTVASGTTLSHSLIQSFVGASSLGLLMSLACPMALLIAESRLPEIRNFLKQEREVQRLPSYNLYNYFKPLLN